ncbi:Rossmann-like and DUF2520 domain-containing protein [Flavobacterium aurantiibacter]|uniref:DUF2520 domain-containing protein n=1 Tax=Flavobacterium aurantiibacter TaxID=2023067 RepID=A0A255ZLH1_9FLAO|nr:Rossmann-like and DUF2520 domain-containing protein [Flavobacterium aurantiibacter]OYQ41490.1 hypothetical protein CHX27_12970 [Flavobacterium aurantiibacter]
MLHISIVGTGNVAFHLAQAIADCKTLKLVEVVGRNPDVQGFPVSCSTSFNHISETDLILIAVADKAIANVVEQIPISFQGTVAHTAASVAMSTLGRFENRGVFYPLQTFSKTKALSWNKLPVFLESNTNQAQKHLESLAQNLQAQLYSASSEQRLKLHLAAVFSCNFVNALFASAEEILNTENVPFDVLKPLIYETVDKAFSLTPKKAQTGPALRNDQTTMQNHVQALTDAELRNLYQKLSELIQNQHGIL